MNIHEPLSPKPEGSKCVYPSDEQVAAWIAEYFESVKHRGMRYEAFLVMKAMDQQREQDALICEGIKSEFSQDLPDESYMTACSHCASAIRAKSQEGESNE